ncbi:thiamine pyrophosphate-dependent enzyme [Aquamicrobium defluvii]|uniref:3D-(3,5/4)-trihydroxycyclohexane-1,2-dione hydrolase n=1 Tax=Aquamicrobium defluvii TaxID=69279 RepID=A0A011V0P7_9HYPH|nr:thiamine pyrophosphate-dependent enzyme [Aquamicrobium defluvii]EXL01995.1 3D-(3,5/4)-trihydroxycyclohexane-1,2-dione hydrolase [Aquamicrobium defluvii]EZQ13551.1 3D-(3,5/4)-trihydroxycyclohexane-1,2-dione hydrolase [Halopseudomonas bauzanensis]TDR35313.1 3D-(3,5/4)-trihydroxycyclohexane-1,2-dione hydrolase [Aquamicrobium defluvii]
MGRKIRLTVGQAIAKFLAAQWTERDGVEQRLIGGACGIFGHGNLSGIGQGLAECGGDIPFFQPFHEQSMVHMAVAYARVKRRLSTYVCTASIGPGTANMYTGAAGATVQRVPVLLLASDHYATRRQGVVLQQLESANYDLSVSDGLRAVSVFYDKIVRPEQLLPSLMEATRVLTSPSEAGAVTLSICQDTQGEAGDFPEELFEKRVWRVERRPADVAQVGRVAEMLAQARRPIIISGGGVYYSEAEQELLAFAERFGVPVVETVAGRSTMPGESEYAMGAVGIAGNLAANELASQADLVLAVGTRLTDVVTCSQTLFRDPDVRFASINITGRDSAKLGSEPILADARLGLSALAEAAGAMGVSASGEWLGEMKRAAADWRSLAEPTLVAEAGKPMNQAQALAIVNEATREQSYVVAAAGSLPGDVAKLWDTRGSRRTHLEFGFSCMTYEIPAGIGLALGGEKNVYVVIGDGTYLMNPSDLLVAARERIKLTVCVFVNHGYQIIRDLQVLTTGDSFSTEFRGRDNSNSYNGAYLDIDIAQNAASLGARVHRAAAPEELKAALAAADAAPGLNVVVIEVDPHKMSVGTKHSFWDIAPPEVSASASTQQLRANYEKRRDELQRHYL